MSQTVQQIYLTNPTTVVADTDLYYLVQSPYTPGSDAAISGASLKAAFGTGGTINPGLINQLGYYAAAGSAISGLATLSNGTLITSAGGAPSISQTLPSAVQGNITSLGTISSGIWNGTVITGTYGGSGVNNGANTATYAGNLNFASSFTTSGAFAVTQTYTGITNVTFPTSGTLATTSQLPTPAALTRVDDTNVTLTLGGTPATALLQATSLTLGWTGTLSGTRGGTGVNNGANTITLGGSIVTGGAHTLSGAFASTFTFTNTTSVTFPTSGTLATTAQIPTGAALTKTDDTNVTLTLGGSPSTALVNAASLTLGWTGQLGLTRGGTNASLTASNGGIVYSTSTALGILSGTATANQVLLSGSSTTPAWSTATYPATTTINQLLYSSSNNTIVGLATANSGVLVTSSGGVPSISSTLPAFTTSSITFSPTTGGIVGTTTNDNADAGKVGEVISSVLLIASEVTLTSLVAANLTSISLTAGDWDVWGEIWFDAASTTVTSSIAGAINTASATFPTVPAVGTSVSCIAYTGIAQGTVGVQQNLPVSMARISLSGTTTIYLNARAGFATSTMKAYGRIVARRAR